MGHYNDTAFGLHQAAQYYYHPGWQEPSGALECFVSNDAYESLSGELRGILEIACMAENDYLLAEFNTRNHTSLNTLVEEHGVQLRRFPDDVLDALRGFSLEVVEELAATDPMSGRVLESYRAFAAEVSAWLRISELS